MKIKNKFLREQQKLLEQDRAAGGGKTAGTTEASPIAKTAAAGAIAGASAGKASADVLSKAFRQVAEMAASGTQAGAAADGNSGQAQNPDLGFVWQPDDPIDLLSMEVVPDDSREGWTLRRPEAGSGQSSIALGVATNSGNMARTGTPGLLSGTNNSVETIQPRTMVRQNPYTGRGYSESVVRQSQETTGREERADIHQIPESSKKRWDDVELTDEDKIALSEDGYIFFAENYQKVLFAGKEYIIVQPNAIDALRNRETSVLYRTERPSRPGKPSLHGDFDAYQEEWEEYRRQVNYQKVVLTDTVYLGVKDFNIWRGIVKTNESMKGSQPSTDAVDAGVSFASNVIDSVNNGFGTHQAKIVFYEYRDECYVTITYTDDFNRTQIIGTDKNGAAQFILKQDEWIEKMFAERNQMVEEGR